MTLVEQMKVGVREKEKWPHGITNIPTRSDSGIGRRLRTSKQNKRMDKLKHEVQRCARSHARSEAAFVRRQGRAFTSIHTRIQHEINIQRVNTWLTVRYVREPLLLSIVRKGVLRCATRNLKEQSEMRRAELQTSTAAVNCLKETLPRHLSEDTLLLPTESSQQLERTFNL
ncbi:hypothetical protein OUZ56_031523 [Daphnia magna]|uniref:Uncharacterized protein n=1 Tax=Daphnia magna TaxID=35525 RepID=A0ABQ9ZUG1_9CRUS|nr:hypothetical protein OUZ56_031523 [Daphnia magna]